jgi:methylated-DNA-protein-cysteine methyltransferase related protein
MNNTVFPPTDEYSLEMARTKRSAAALFRPIRTPAEPRMNLALETLWHVIATIPRGQVSTYGDVARMAGLPGHARQTAYALRNMPQGMNLPWHRVLGAGGKIVFPKGSKHHREQTRRLRSDGIPVKDGKVPRTFIMNADHYR